MKKKLFLAVLLSTLLAMLMPAAPSLAQGNSDEVLLKNSREHYVRALTAYNEGDLGEAAGQLQAAASNAKHVDPVLAGLLNAFGFGVDIPGSIDEIASQIASIYNGYNRDFGWGYSNFDPEHPTAVPPGEGQIT